MIFPLLTGFLPWLTPLATVGLAAILALAIFIEHLPKKEYNVLPMNAALLVLSLLIIFERWSLFLES